VTDVGDRLRTEGLDAAPWSNGPGDRYGVHEHGYDKVVVCAVGSISFGLPDVGATIQLAEGDRLELPAGTRHDAAVGPGGVTCHEAHLDAGTFETPRRRAAGEW
jgi:hypothetical protein